MDLMIIMPNMFYLNKYLCNFTMKITKYENRIKDDCGWLIPNECL